MSLLFSSTSRVEHTDKSMNHAKHDSTMYINLLKTIEDRLNQTLLGKQDVIRKLLICTLAGGHVLLEDKPGVGKTKLAKALAQLLGGSFRRIQFTSDLLPADVVGGLVWQAEKMELAYRQGPIMANIVLGDELNRASGRTQSALLEALEERYITIDGETYPLPHPFMFIATQNPLSYSGTNRLPEAQLDRFMMKLSIGYPSELFEQQLLYQYTNKDDSLAFKPVMTDIELAKCINAVKYVHVHDTLLSYMSKLATVTRQAEHVKLALSPRALREWLRAAQAKAYLEERNYVLPDDLLYTARDVLAHRLIMDSVQQGDDGATYYIDQLLSQLSFEKVIGRGDKS